MPKESLQKKVGRVRPPRVHITYDVETGGAIEKRELPFVVGVMADLSAMPANALPPIKQRKFVEVDRDNFDKVLSKCEPRLTYKVDNKLRDDDTRLGVELKFQSMADFEPEQVAKQIEPLRKLLELRTHLANLRGSLSGNDKLDALLQQVIQDTEALQKLKAEMSVSADAPKESE